MAEAVEFELDPEERDVFLRYAAVSPGLKARLRFGLHGAHGLVYNLPLPMFDEFMQALLILLDNPPKSRDSEIIDCIYARLAPIDDEVFGFEEDNQEDIDQQETDRILAQMPPHLRDAVVAILNDPRFESPEQVSAALEALIQSHNTMPIANFSGLSSQQLMTLLTSNWEHPEAAFHVNPELTLDDVQDSQFFHNARCFLAALGEEGTKATSNGNLSPKFVHDLVHGDLRFPHKEMILEVSKRTYEEDFYVVMRLRIVLKFAGLLRKHKGRFKRTKLGKELLADEAAGPLYNLLFVTMLQEYDLSYPYLDPELTVLQAGLPYGVYVLSKLATDWIDIDQVAPRLFVETMMPDLSNLPAWCDATTLAQHFVLWPMQLFNLVEIDDERVRVTELFHKFFSVKI